MGDHHMIFEVTARADAAAARAALTTAEGVQGWWTDTVTVTEGLGGKVEPSFPEVPRPFDLYVTEASDDRIEWTAGEFPPPWAGTRCVWTIGRAPDGAGITVRMEHRDWDAGNPMVGMVTVTWGQIMGNLERYLESGSPDPYFTS